MRRLVSFVGQTREGRGIAYVWSTGGSTCAVHLVPSAHAREVLEWLERHEAAKVDETMHGIARWIATTQAEQAGVWTVALHPRDASVGAPGPGRFVQLLERLHAAELVSGSVLDAIGAAHPHLTPILRAFAADWLD